MSIAGIDINEEWQAGNATIAAIIENGYGKYLKGLSNHDSAFEIDQLIVVCIDGRTRGAICLAGSGILLGLEGSLQYAKEVEKLYGKIEAITWHPDCGAAAAYAKKHHRKDPSECAEEFAKLFAQKLGVEAYEVENYGHDGFHPERVVYYDGTGRFNSARVAGLPIGLTVSRAYLGFDVEYAKSELALALGITLTPHHKGGHGFGEKFTEAEPLIVVVIGHDRRELEKLTAEAREVISALSSADQQRVKLDGFIKP